MKRGKYIYDAASGVFRKSVVTVGELAVKALKYLAASLALAAVWYVIFALLVNTDVEKRLKAENRVYEEQWADMKDDLNLLNAVVSGLEYRDNAIYEEVFRSSVPEMLEIEPLLSEDEITDAVVADITREKLATALDGASKVDGNFRRIFSKVLDEGYAMPPVSAPVEGFDVTAAGASLGQKMSPFLKMETAHNGLDIVAQGGTKVLAAADGTVSDVSRSGKGEGNVVTVQHAGGYITRYAHLGSISVTKGAKVRRGSVIGTIGLSGVSYAPHLHYEVFRDTVLCNPVNHMFVSVTPEQYVYLERVASGTGQSLD